MSRTWREDNLLRRYNEKMGRLKENTEDLMRRLMMSTIDFFFNDDEETLTEGSMGKKILTAALILGLGASSLFAGINNTSEKVRLDRDKAEKFQSVMNDMDSPYLFFVDSDSGKGYLAVSAQAGSRNERALQNRANNVVRKFINEHESVRDNLENFDFNEISKGYLDTDTNSYITVYEVARI